MVRLSVGWLVVAVLLGLSVLRVSGWSYGRGYRAAEQVQARALAAAAAEVAGAEAVTRRAEAVRLATEAERDVLARQLEEMAHADPDGGRIALGVDSVRRLNRR